MEPVVHADTAAATRLAELALTAADLISALLGADREASPSSRPAETPGEELWADADGADLATWLLLYHVTSSEIHAELSLANGIDYRGHVSDWLERIILPCVPRTAC